MPIFNGVFVGEPFELDEVEIVFNCDDLATKTDAELDEIATFLNRQTYSQSHSLLRFTGNVGAFSQRFFERLFPSINAETIALNFSGCGLNLAQLATINGSLDGVDATKITAVNFSHNEINGEALEVLPYLLQALPSLQELDLSHNRIFARTLPDVEIYESGEDGREEYYGEILRKNGVTTDEAAGFLQFLSGCRNLRVLSLTGNEMRNIDATNLCVRARNWPNLNRLNLRDNLFGVNGILAVSAMLEYFPQLAALDLSGNLLGDIGFQELLEAATDCHQLKELNVADAGIRGEVGIGEMPVDLLGCKNLKVVDLRGNALLPDFLQRLSDVAEVVRSRPARAGQGIVFNGLDLPPHDVEAVRDLLLIESLPVPPSRDGSDATTKILSDDEDDPPPLPPRPEGTNIFLDPSLISSDSDGDDDPPPLPPRPDDPPSRSVTPDGSVPLAAQYYVRQPD